MTSFAVTQAFLAADENMWRLALRTALYSRAKRLPRSEAEVFKKIAVKPKRQSIRDQFAAARMITAAMTRH